MKKKKMNKMAKKMKPGKKAEISTSIKKRPISSVEAAAEKDIDITERKRAEEAIVRAAHEWQTTFDSTNHAIWILDQDQRVLRSNKTAERLFRRPREEFTGKHCWEIVHGTAQPIPECPILRARNSLRRETMELQIGEGWFEVAVDPMLDAAGQYAGAVHIVSDITERKRAEEEIANLAKFPTENPNPVLRLSRDGIVIYANAASDALLGMWDCAVGSYAPQSWRDLIAQALASGQNKSIDVECAEKVYSFFVVPVAEVGYVNLYGCDITERKQAEEALRESEARYSKLIETSPDGISIIGVDGKIAYISSKILDIYGYEDDSELIGHMPVEWIAPEDREKAAANIRKVFEGGYFSNNRYQLLRKDGSRFWGEINSAALADAQGNPTGMIAITRDVTEQVRVEAVLRESEERFRAIASNTPDHILMQDRQLRYMLVVNPQLGLTEEDMLGKTDHDFLLKEEADKLTQVKTQVLESGQPVHFETSLISKAGETEFFDGSYIPKFDAQGQVDGLIGYFRNVTERERAEQALRESEVRYRELFENINSGVAVYEVIGNGQDFIFKEFNRAGEKIDHDQRERLIGKSIFELRPGVEQFGLIDVFRKVLQTGEPAYYPVTLYQDERLTGWYENYVYKLPSGEIVAVFENVTERKRTEEQIAYQAQLLAIVNDAVVASDEQYRINAWNAAAESMYGWKAEEVLGRFGLDITCTEFPGVEKDEMLRVIAEHGSWRGEATQARKDGTRFPVEVSSVSLRDVTGKVTGFVSVNRDITERKRAEEALRESEDRYRAVVEDMTEVISRFRNDGTLIFVNEVFCRFFGKRVKELIGHKWQPLAVSDDMPHIESQIRKLRPSNPTVLIESRFYSGTGKVHWMQLVNRGFFDADGCLQEIQSVGRDITERKRVEEELVGYRKDLRKLTHRLVHAQETERKEISRELHDEIGQALTAIKINLTEMEKDIPPECKPQIKERIAESDAIVDKMLEQIHEMSLDLHPAMLDDLGLVPTLRWYGKRFAKRVDINVKLELKDLTERMDPSLETNLYRIVQEALTNVARHAHATKVVIRLKLEQSILQLSITDDGCGFDVKKSEEDRSATQGMGLIGMHERVASIQGRLDIESSPEHRTSLMISVPWKGR